MKHQLSVVYSILLGLAAALVLVPFVATPALAQKEEIYDIKELRAAKENYSYIRSLMVMMNERRPLKEIDKVVYEVERYIIIQDDLLEVAKIFYSEGPELKGMRREVAKSHLLLVAFYIYQKNYSGAMEHFRQAEELYPEMYEDVDLEVEIKADRDKSIRNLFRYDMKSITEFKSWYEGDVGEGYTFEVEVTEDFEPQNLQAITVKSLDVMSTESASYRLIELANNEIAKQLSEGKRFFRLTLAPGTYELTQEAGTIFPQKFAIESTDQQPFTVLIQPDNWFTLAYAQSYKGSQEPKLYYNGILMDSSWFDKMPYGEYEIRVDRKEFDFEFGKIEFVSLDEGGSGEVTQGAGVVTIPVASQARYLLDVGKKSAFAKVFDTSAD